ncbi:unnamed protein product [Moneuplotes crassus]|uniref:Uncharacterized protein n=1 Tax=Euplotes crassus TaxID=5936 RepID=A0AAD1UTX8_EUPCR|nr:unnamed protein product [Moneuplotes crassus]
MEEKEPNEKGKKNLKRHLIQEEQSLSLSVEEKEEEPSDAEIENAMYASPWQWVPLSILTAIVFASGNAIVSSLSKFTYRIRIIQAPGSVLGCSFLLMMVSIFDHRRGRPNWFKRLYFEHPHHGFKNQRFRYPRVALTIGCVIVFPIQFYTFTMSYFYANKAGINNGVIMVICTLKPIINAIAFRLLYHQKLRYFEILGILLSTVSIVIIGFSEKSDSEGHKGLYMLLSMVFLFLAVFLEALIGIVVKYFLAFKDNKANVSSFYAFFIGILDSICVIILIVLLNTGFDITWKEIGLAQASSILYAFAQFTMAFAILKGKAGTASALIETVGVYQTIIEAVVYSRFPNVWQIIGIALAFLASIMIVLGYHFSRR